MIQSKDLKYSYPNGPSFEFPDIDLAKEEHMLILGPSGVGKTTLLHLLSGILPATSGEITINGTEITALQRKQLDRFRGENVGVIFQQYHYVKSLSVEENLIIRQHFPKRADHPQRRLTMAERLGLSNDLKKKVNELSRGQQQRLAIALGLIHQPKLILADEPTSNLDDLNCSKVMKLLKEEARLCESSLIIITHDQRVKEHFNKAIIL